jgi:proteasome lid subunit RPN8/RPN11
MKIRREVLDPAFEHLRRCGQGRNECVVYLTGPLDTPDLIDAAIHPAHTATEGGYEVGTAAIAELWKELLSSRRSVRAQVHTHPGPAYHSGRDDAFALVSTPGYLSLVVPNFALGPVGLDGAFLAERDRDGGWASASVSDRLEIVA